MKNIAVITRRLISVFLMLVVSLTLLMSPASAVGQSVKPLDDTNFDDEALKSDLPVIVHFDATWCGPCKVQAPILEKIAQDYQGKVKVFTLDIDNAASVTGKYGIKSVPTLVFLKNDENTLQLKGLTSRENIIKGLSI